MEAIRKELGETFAVISAAQEVLERLANSLLVLIDKYDEAEEA